MVRQSVFKPAVGQLQSGSGISVTDYFKDKLCQDNVVLGPVKSEFSGDPQKILCDLIEKSKHDLPGVKIICFYEIRLISGRPSIIRMEGGPFKTSVGKVCLCCTTLIVRCLF